MNEKTKVGIIVVVILVFAAGAFLAINQIKNEQEYQKKDIYCKMLTKQLNENISNSSGITSYYCYYNPVIPKQFYGKAQPLCECDAKTVNGTILHIWVGSSI